MEKKIENMAKKELIERINDLETQCEDKDTAFTALHEQHVKFGQKTRQEIAAYEAKIATLKKQVYEAATAREDDFNILKEKNEAIHEEAKRWKKEAVEAQAELDDLRSAIGADDSDPISVAIWKAKYHTLKYQFDKLKDEDRKWTSANPAVQAALERKINVLEKEINKLKAESSDWEAKYEYQKGQTDCVVSYYNKLNKKYESLCIDYAALSRRHDDLSAKYSNDVGKVTCLEERIKDLIKQCDELYDRNKELDAENEQRRKDLRETVKENQFLRKEIRDLNDKNDRLKKTVNKIYGIASSTPDTTCTADFEDRARKCAIIFSRTIDDMINAYNTDVNSCYDGSILGVTKTVNTIRGGHIWLDSLEESMRKLSEEVEKYIKRVGEKND